MSERHVEGVKQAAEIVHLVDPVHPTLGDANGRAIDDCLPFKPYLDIFMPYAYPVATQSIAWYENYLGKRRKYLGDPGQFQLLTYVPVALGYKGVVWFAYHTLIDDPDRAHQVAILNSELQRLGPLAITIQPTDRADAFATYRASKVRTYCLEGEDRMLVFVFSWRDSDFRTLGTTGYARFPIRVRLRGAYDFTLPTGPTLEAYQVGYLGLRKMRSSMVDRATMDIHLDRLDSMGVYLVTKSDDPLIDELRTSFDWGLEDAVSHAVPLAELQTAYMTHAWNTAAKYGLQFYALPRLFEKLMPEARNAGADGDDG